MFTLFLIQHNNRFGSQLKLSASKKTSYTFGRYWFGADQFKISTETLLKHYLGSFSCQDEGYSICCMAPKVRNVKIT